MLTSKKHLILISSYKIIRYVVVGLNKASQPCSCSHIFSVYTFTAKNVWANCFLYGDFPSYSKRFAAPLFFLTVIAKMAFGFALTDTFSRCHNNFPVPCLTDTQEMSRRLPCNNITSSKFRFQNYCCGSVNKIFVHYP